MSLCFEFFFLGLRAYVFVVACSLWCRMLLFCLVCCCYRYCVLLRRCFIVLGGFGVLCFVVGVLFLFVRLVLVCV